MRRRLALGPRLAKRSVPALMLAVAVAAAAWTHDDAEAAPSSEAAVPLASGTAAGERVNVAEGFGLAVDTESVTYGDDRVAGGRRGRWGRAATDASGTTCANPSDDFAVLCTAFNKLRAVYVDGPVDVAQLASDAAAGVRAAGLAARTTDPPPCALPSPEFREMCTEIDKAADTKAAAWAAAVAMFEGVDDDYVLIFEPDAWARLIDSGDSDPTSHGRLGLSYGLLDGDEPCSVPSATCRPVIYEVLADSPADDAGLKVGDVLVSIKGQSSFACSDVDGLDSGFADGETVAVVVERAGTNHTYALTAADVADPFAFDLVVDGNVGYLHLDKFAEQSSRSFAQSLRRLLDADVASLVVDLRHNPGGSGAETMSITANFLERGDLITRWVFANNRISEQRAISNGIASDDVALPMAVTVDGGSASGSEMFALAMTGHDRAVLVGARTYGKHTGWNGYTVYASDGTTMLGGVLIKSAYFYGPGGTSSEGGIAPDHSADLPMCLHPVGLVRAALPALYPQITSVAFSSSPAGDAYADGDRVVAAVALNRPVTVDTADGVPYLELEVGGEVRRAAYQSASSSDPSTVLEFAYTIDGDADDDGMSIAADSLKLNAGTIRHALGWDAVLSHDAVAPDPLQLVSNAVAPSGLSAVTGDVSARVSWLLPTQPAGVYVDEMRLEQLDSDGAVARSTIVEYDPLDGVTYEQSVRGLSPGSAYRFRVRLVLWDGADVASPVLAVTTESESPAAPSNVTAIAADGGVELSWSFPAQPGWLTDDGFVDVVRSTASPFADAEWPVSDRMAWQRGQTSWRFIDADVRPGYTYRYRVRAYLGDQLLYSDYAEVTVPSLAVDPDGTRDSATVLDAAAAVGGVRRLCCFSVHRRGGDAVDYYAFTTTERYELVLIARWMRGAWDETLERGVSLQDAQGNVVPMSWTWPSGTVIEPGTYYLRVEAVEDGPIPYFLRFGLTDPPDPAPSAALSDDASLSGLWLGEADLGAFDPATVAYSAEVAHDIGRTTVSATVNHTGASYLVSVGGSVDADGVVDLAAGANVITVTVTAQDAVTTRAYTVTVTRAAPPPVNVPPAPCPPPDVSLRDLATVDRMIVDMRWLIANESTLWSGDPMVIPATAIIRLWAHDSVTELSTHGIESITLEALSAGSYERVDGIDQFAYGGELMTDITFTAGCTHTIPRP